MFAIAQMICPGNGGRGNRWSLITIRMGKLHHCMTQLYIYLASVRSPAACEALKRFLAKLLAKSTCKHT